MTNGLKFYVENNWESSSHFGEHACCDQLLMSLMSAMVTEYRKIGTLTNSNFQFSLPTPFSFSVREAKTQNEKDLVKVTELSDKR